jgi:hypothetical protein
MELSVVLLIIGVWSVVPWLLKYRRAKQTEAWPHVPGCIVKSAIQREQASSWVEDSGEIETYLVRYAYVVDGASLESDTVSIQGRHKPAEITQKYPIRATVEVFYNPNNPKHAVLEPGGTPKLWRLIIGLTVLSAGFAIAAVFALAPILHAVLLQK